MSHHHHKHPTHKPGKHEVRRENEGEGSRTAARDYNSDLQSFIRDNRVEPAAKEAKQYVETHGEQAAEAERAAQAGPRPIAKRVEELVMEGRAMVSRGVSRVRSIIRNRSVR